MSCSWAVRLMVHTGWCGSQGSRWLSRLSRLSRCSKGWDCIELSKSFFCVSITDTIAASSSPPWRMQTMGNDQWGLRANECFSKAFVLCLCLQRRPSCAGSPTGPSWLGTYGTTETMSCRAREFTDACRVASRKHACEARSLPLVSNMGRYFAEVPASARPWLQSKPESQAGNQYEIS